jgi:predicted flap endonuclease-1-like 5' DNA nuclease
VNGLSLLALVIAVCAGIFAFRAGVMRGRREPHLANNPLGESAPARRVSNPAVETAIADVPPPIEASTPSPPAAQQDAHGVEETRVAAEQARIIRSYERELSRLGERVPDLDAAQVTLASVIDDRARLHRELADVRAETARYRQIVIDIENNAPPPLLDGPGAPDDLKLIVGVGPVLERMLHQLGITTYRQVAWWTERDIDDFDDKLAEFPGRIRRDGWVTQARELHLSKYGQPPARH